MTLDELRRLERFMEECGIGIDDIIEIVQTEMDRRDKENEKQRRDNFKTP